MQPIHFSQHTDAEWLSVANEKLAQPGLPDWEEAFWSFVAEWYSPAASVVVHTSGSTGKPKALRVGKEMMRASAQKTLRFFNLQPHDVALLCLSAHYIAGKMMIVRAILGQLSLYVVEPSALPLQGMEGGVAFAAMVPMQVFEQLKISGSLNSVQKLLIGGGAVSASLAEGLQACTCEAYESYGMTETVSHVALRRINGAARQDAFVPMPQVNIGVDGRGCVVIDAPGLLAEPLTTNDRAELLPNGGFRLWGRMDNVINSGGIKIQPEVVEQQIASCFDVPFAISSVPDAKLGEKLVLVAEGCLTEYSVRTANILLHPYQRVHLYVAVAGLPRTASQKLDRPALRRFLSANTSILQKLD